MSSPDLYTPEEWRVGLGRIRDDAQAAMGEAALIYQDVTPEVLDLADDVWGRHDVSPDMKIEVAARFARTSYPYLYAKEKLLYDYSPVQGAYLDPNTGLFVVQKPEFVYDWLEGRELPAESAFALAREATLEKIGKEGLLAALPTIRERRAVALQYAVRFEEERVRNEVQTEKLQQLTATDPLLSRLTEGMTDDNRKTLAANLRGLNYDGMIVWDPSRWGVTSKPPTFEEAKAILEEHDGSSGQVLTECPGPGAICELKDFGRIRGRRYVDFSNRRADHAILRWVGSQAGNHGHRVVAPIGHTVSAEEKRLVELQLNSRSSYFGMVPNGDMLWDGPQKPGYMLKITQDVQSDYDGAVYKQDVGTLYFPSN